jgi:peptide/nickel transport system substrate-binding protein
MCVRKKRRMLCFLGVSILLLFVSTYILPEMPEGKAQNKTEWVWTKKNPKPSWWTWGKDFEPRKPVRGGYLRTAASTYIGLMNPNHWPVNDWVAMTYMYEMLIYNDHEFKPTVLWLAKSWRYTNPQTVIMELREGVKFHDGTDFDAESLKYQIEWVMDKKNGAWTRAWIEPVKSITVIDKHTVKWEFKRPWGAFQGIMANVPGYAISAKALRGDVALKESKKIEKRLETAKKKLAKLYEKSAKAVTSGDEKAKKKYSKKIEKAREKVQDLEKQSAESAAYAKDAIPLDKHAVGSGKYMVEVARPGNYLKLKRNPNWWFGKSIGQPEMPYLDGILITIIPDPSVQLANLRAAKLDSIGVDPSQYSMIKNDPNLKIYVYPGNHQMSLRFNLAKGPCKDIRVRKAISHAIDRKALIKGVVFGMGIEASCMYPEVHWGHNPNLKPVNYDPELSKKLLAEAGYSSGLTVKGYMGNAPWLVTTTEAVKRMLAKVNIDWKVDVVDSVSGSDRMRNLEYDFAAGGWVWILDPDLMATGLYHPDGGFNYGRSNNNRAIELIMAGREEIDVNKRQRIYWQLEKVLYDNYEDAWLWWPLSITAFRKNVYGWNQEMYLAGREGFWFSHCRWFEEGHQ